MEKNFTLTSDQTVRKTVAIGAGIMITLFSCTNDPYTSVEFTKGGTNDEYTTECLSLKHNDIEISLASNVDIDENCSYNAEDSNDKRVLEDFASAILKNTKPLDSEISKLVDDNFWDLI